MASRCRQAGVITPDAIENQRYIWKGCIIGSFSMQPFQGRQKRGMLLTPGCASRPRAEISNAFGVDHDAKPLTQAKKPLYLAKWIVDEAMGRISR
jgi:hypothetical protein